MTDVTAIVLLLVIPVVMVLAFLILARSRRASRWAADHSIACRRFGIVGGALGFAVAAFWAGRFFGLW